MRFIAVVMLVATAACAPGADYETERMPLVGGEPVSGWDPVGALVTRVPGFGYGGPFCSGTLIAKDWVLTAAHCVTGGGEMPVLPKLVSFFVGSNALPAGAPGLFPNQGEMHQADAFFIHPDYSQGNNKHDIALVHLADPIEDIQPVVYHTEPLSLELSGEEVLYVGFGVNDGEHHTGGGIKRSGYIPIMAVDQTIYVSGFEGTGVCFGDSGGPGMLQFDGQTWEIIGVNSWVASGNDDPCKGVSVQTRVDAHKSWLAKARNDFNGDCRDWPELCWCPQACGDDGRCENELCRSLSCAEALACMANCADGDAYCKAACDNRSGPDAVAQLRDLGRCLYLQCELSLTDPVDDCAEEWCAEKRAACEETPKGGGDCRDVLWCSAACEPGDAACREACRDQGSKDAGEAFSALALCLELECAEAIGLAPEPGCAWESCEGPLAACLPAADCALSGGDCPKGTACRETPTGQTDCFPSGDGAAGAACESGECADGLACIDSVCVQVCTANEHCQEGDLCDGGLCRCIDDDGDGACLVDDCDDADETIRPGAGERCYDGVDNNCDGEVDEGCPVIEEDDGAASGGCSVAGPGGGLWLVILAMLALWGARRAPPSPV